MPFHSIAQIAAHLTRSQGGRIRDKLLMTREILVN